MGTPDAILFPILAGAGLAAALAGPFVYRRIRAANANARAALAEADKARRLLAASPDSSFMFEPATGNEFCSRRLARLFGLGDDGRGVRFVDVLGKLDPADAEALMRAVTGLRAQGTRFETVVTKDGAILAVAGTRAADAAGHPIADAVWFRPVPDILAARPPAAPPHDAAPPSDPHPGGLTEILDALGAPIAVFGADGRLQACNAACARLWRMERPWLETGPALGEILEGLRARRRLPEVADFRVYKAEQAALLTLADAPPPILMHLPDNTVL
ncbi:MAG: hypothetical protein FJX42_03020, partial [Alphaproteobacteria bacterium]|nr:hypothetical protein [Alphaproteobacteria bacterium]